MNKSNVKTIGSKGVVSADDIDVDMTAFSEEEKQRMVGNIRYQARKMIRHTMLSQFKQVYAKILKGQTLQEIIQEVYDKKSDMTKSARDFVTNFKEEVIQEWIDDVQHPELSEKNNTNIDINKNENE
jgi:hypothetical protein